MSMTGIDALRQIKQNKYLKSTPVLVLTTTDDTFANAIRHLALFFSVIEIPAAAT
jgi:CheY-like chemotaxis protein